MNDNAEEMCSALIPIKSRKLYERTYDNFAKWCKIKKIKCITENVVLEYVTGIYDKYKTSSLWTQYSMLKATLIAHKNVDISKFKKVLDLLKGKTDNCVPKKTLILTREHIDTFISKAPDERFLMIKVALIIGVSGACRREELCALTIDNIEDTDSSLIVTIQEPTTKIIRKFTIHDNHERKQSYLAFIKKYAALRPANAEHRRFFIFYKNGRCSTQVIGKNTFSKLPTIIATFLGLPDPDLYSGSCFRKYKSLLLADADITTVKRHGGWKTTSVVENRKYDCK